MARIDRIKPIEKIPEYYSDFDINLRTNPVTGNLARLTNAEAVKQSIMNLVLTSIRERPYQPQLGSQIRRSLFEPVSPITLTQIQESVKEVIENYEPRANVIRIDVIDALDINSYIVNVIFSIANIQDPQNVQIVLERVR